ncbi:PAS/PAC sensor signal transduction histidine kinase [Alteromonadaceae bacterium Bs31]|nr:PAS/PAC sensor signal transduction histidine kinase [Alteromonadaceae bacterium Bs31]
MFRKGVASQIRWLLIYLLVGFTIGQLLGAVWPMLFISTLAYLAWVLFQIHKLEAWVTATRQQGLQENTMRGVWAEIAEDVELITKRYEKDKQRLQEVVERVQDMTSALADGVIIVDKLDNIEWWNRAAERQFDFEPLDIGRKLTDYISHPKFIAYYDSHQYEEPLDLISIKHEGQFLQFHIHPFGDGDSLVIARDITRVAKLERMRKDFIANVSHELRTPLTVLSGYLETLADSAELSPAWGRALDQMQDQTRRMTSLVKDLLMLSRLETQDREQGQTPVHLLPIIEQIVADGKVLSGEKGHIFHIDCPAQIHILGKEGELRSAFANLLYNAVNYTPPGKKISVLADINAHELLVKVKDDGEGIGAKHIPRLTERFYRIDDGRSRDSGGTGLGLAIVKHILLRHDAELRIHSTLGKGSTFSCCFPLERCIQAPQQAPSATG